MKGKEGSVFISSGAHLMCSNLEDEFTSNTTPPPHPIPTYKHTHTHKPTSTHTSSKPTVLALD